MASKKGKATSTGDELLAQLDDLGAEETSIGLSSKPATSRASRPTTGPAQPVADPLAELAELENLAQGGSKSRPQTPRPNTIPTRTTATPPPASSRSSEDKAAVQTRKSGESTRSFHQSFTPAESDEAEKKSPAAPEASSGGGWWGGFMATASAAVKQAEALAKELQKNEEAQRWAEQVKGNVGALRGLGGELRSRALPTFTNILHTLAPPISSHERLQIHITHDLIGYPSLDPLIYQTFSRIMAQVEGGDLMVIQRGQESARRRNSDAGYTGSSMAGWSDGPWWRVATEKRDLGSVKGLVEGTKLSRVSAESYANDYFAARGGVEEAAMQASQALSESNPTRSSDIFLSIQAVSHTASPDLFGGPPKTKEESNVVDPGDTPDELISFAIYLFDPIHSITFHTVSQSVPQKWIDWLDSTPGPGSVEGSLPEDIAEIITSGGVDPREWVAEWTEEVLSLAVGVVAQKYVAKRMGVGEGGMGRGKAREETIDSGAGELARAM